MKINLPDLFIFDMDGLMFDTEKLFMNFIINTANDYGYTFTRSLYFKTIGTTGNHLKEIIFSELGDNYPFDTISSIAKEKMSDYLNNNPIPIKSGLIELLKYISLHNIPCCIASSSNMNQINSYLNNANISNYFSYIVSGDMIKNSKPSPDIFLKACEHYNVAPSQALVLEDSYNGIIAAYSAQIPSICVPDLIKPNKFMIAHTLVVLSTLDELIELF